MIDQLRHAMPALLRGSAALFLPMLCFLPFVVAHQAAKIRGHQPNVNRLGRRVDRPALFSRGLAMAEAPIEFRDCPGQKPAPGPAVRLRPFGWPCRESVDEVSAADNTDDAAVA